MDKPKSLAPNYVTRLPNGWYEFGWININYEDRKHDSRVPMGAALTLEDACALNGMCVGNNNMGVHNNEQPERYDWRRMRRT